MSEQGVPRVGLRELRHDTRGVVERVRQGEAVDITDRGEAVARIVPVAASRPPDALDRLVTAGLARRATRRGPLRPPVRMPGVDLGRALQEMRDEEPY
jgi:prevent-host-death family protein